MSKNTASKDIQAAGDDKSTAASDSHKTSRRFADELIADQVKKDAESANANKTVVSSKNDTTSKEANATAESTAKAAAPEAPMARMKAEHFAKMLEDNFSTFDMDKNGFVSRKELQFIIDLKHPLVSEDTAKIALLKFDDLTKMNNSDGIDLTHNDAHRFRYKVDPTHGYNKDMYESRATNYGMGTFDLAIAASTGVSAIVYGAFAIADPEPITKMTSASTAALLGVTSLTLGICAADRFSTPSAIKKDYEAQRRILKSWDVFTQNK